jgi:hypothetical protein
VLGSPVGISVANGFVHGWADSSTSLVFWTTVGLVVGEPQEGPVRWRMAEVRAALRHGVVRSRSFGGATETGRCHPGEGRIGALLTTRWSRAADRASATARALLDLLS